MKILVVCQYYYPEPFRITDICEELVRLGHEVTVVTGLPNYPMGEIYEGYQHGEKRDEVLNGVKIHRCYTVGRKHGTFHRMLNYYSYSISSTRYVARITEEYDVIFVNQLSPVLMANAGIYYKKRHEKKLLMYSLDLWPESLTVGGILRESPIYRLFHRISEKIYKQADKIMVTSKSFSTYFEKEFGIKCTEYLPQYAEELFTPEICKKEPDGKIDLMFAGNIGAAQSVDTIVKAAKLTKNVEGLHWHIVGDGSELEDIKKQAEGLNNVSFYGRKPLKDMPKFYSMADVMLVTMKDDPVISLTLPGKVQTYMVAGKAILGAIEGETRAVISEAKCGVCVDAEDATQLAEAAAKLTRAIILEQSINANKYYNNNFSKKVFMNRLEEQLEDMGK